MNNFINTVKSLFKQTEMSEKKQDLNNQNKLEKIKKMLKGEWSNIKQASEFPALWSHIRVFYTELPENLLDGKSFYIESKDTEKILKLKTQKLEYQIFPESIFKIFRGN